VIAPRFALAAEFAAFAVLAVDRAVRRTIYDNPIKKLN